MARTTPNLAYEEGWWSRGLLRVCGIDEVGRGAWAGPVVAATVILPDRGDVLLSLREVRDSKVLSPAARERIAEQIRAVACEIGVGVAPSSIVTNDGLLAATAVAMRRALDALRAAPDHTLIDGLPLRQLGREHQAIIRGDALCLSIAAASIVAKVERDALMRGLDGEYPPYGFAAHKGYGTARHREALLAYGPSPVHRLSYAPVAEVALSREIPTAERVGR